MKYGFINKAVHSLISCFNTTPAANSTQELALVVSHKTNQLQTTGDLERDQNREDINKVKKDVKLAKARNFIVGANMLLLGAIGNANAADTQNTLQDQQKAEAKVTTTSIYDDVVTPEEHSAAHPFELLNTGTTDGTSTRKVGVMGGGAVVTLLPGNPGTHYVLSPDGRSFTSQTVNFDKPGNRHVEYNDGSSSSNKIITVKITWQARIKNGDVAFVAPEETVKISAGPNMTRYAWNSGASRYGGTQNDSTENVQQGKHIVMANDGTGNRTNDTIAVVERPVANPIARRLDFSATVAGVTYKIYKAEKVGNDTVWTEVPSLSFVGNGNPTSVNTGLGDFKIGAIRRAGADVVEAKDEKTLKVDFGTEVYEMREKPEPTFVVNGRTLYFKEDVKYQIIDMSGRIIKTGKGNMESVPQAGLYILLIDNQTHKIHISP